MCIRDSGNAVLNAWVAAQGKSSYEITPLQRLQYTGKRGMGALEYSPATKMKHLNSSRHIEIDSLVSIAQEIIDSRGNFSVELNKDGQEDREAIMSLLSVGMSAGGARPKGFWHLMTILRRCAQVKPMCQKTTRII